VLLKFSSGQIERSGHNSDSSPFPMEKQQNPFIEDFRTFSMRGRTQGFNFEQESYDRLKFIELIRYVYSFQVDFKLISILTFVGLKSFQSSSHSGICKCKIMTYISPMRSSSKEKLCQI
jgi:hypothetical protein